VPGEGLEDSSVRSIIDGYVRGPGRVFRLVRTQEFLAAEDRPGVHSRGRGIQLAVFDLTSRRGLSVSLFARVGRVCTLAISTRSKSLVRREVVFLFSSKRRCPDCHSRNVRKSMRLGLVDNCILPVFLLRPFRCDRCNRRYFGLFFAERVKTDSKDSFRATQPNSEGAAGNRTVAQPE